MSIGICAHAMVKQRVTAWCLLVALTVFIFCTTLSADPPNKHEIELRTVHAKSQKDDDGGRHESVCLTPACVSDEASMLARAFPFRLDRTWCNREDGQSGYRGIILAKVPKTGSSTVAGVTMRIGHRLGCENVHWDHRRNTAYANTERWNSFLFAPVRDPGSRAISRIWFTELSRHTYEGSDDALGVDMIGWLKNRTHHQFGLISPGQGGFQLQYASLHEIDKWSAWRPDQPTKVRHASHIINNVRSIVERYDMLLLSERMDESLVVMSILMGLQVGDVLVVPSKQSGQNWVYSRVENACYPILKGATPAIVYEYLSSDEWRAANYGDLVLHAAANKSLDLTINAIGRDPFDAAMLEYQRLKKSVLGQCSDRVQYPCSDEGVPQTHLSELDCYSKWHDEGCGYRCVDAILEQDSMFEG